MWHDHIHYAIRELYPDAVITADYLWVSTEDGPAMSLWNAGKLGPLDMAAIEARAAEIAARPAPALTKLAKATLWRRCTDTEAEALHYALSQASFRLRLIFEAAQYLDNTDDDYPALRAGIVAAVGEARAAELLAPEF